MTTTSMPLPTNLLLPHQSTVISVLPALLCCYSSIMMTLLSITLVIGCTPMQFLPLVAAHCYQHTMFGCHPLCCPICHCGDSKIWFRVCSCQNSNRANHGPQKNTKISRCPIMTNAYMFGDNKSVVTS